MRHWPAVTEVRGDGQLLPGDSEEMMELLNEIRTGMASLDRRGSMLGLKSVGDGFRAWVFREGDSFGVAVKVPEQVCVSERFAGARLVTVDRAVSGVPCRLLRLESVSYGLRNEFAVVCAQMVDPGPGGVHRNALVADPRSWWQNWRQLLGNAVVDVTAYSVLGEMLALEHLYGLGMEPVWRGPATGSVDIETPGIWYEVKSTLTRYDMRVEIAGQFQLDPPTDKKLLLVHQRFEPSAEGVSVDSAVQRLVALGADRDGLEKLLDMCDLEPGSAARSATWRLLDSRQFAVDAGFPRITPESFNGGALPAGVVKIGYTVDLSGFPHTGFCAT
jgi:hypothetical protein